MTFVTDIWQGGSSRLYLGQVLQVTGQVQGHSSGENEKNVNADGRVNVYTAGGLWRMRLNSATKRLWPALSSSRLGGAYRASC